MIRTTGRGAARGRAPAMAAFCLTLMFVALGVEGAARAQTGPAPAAQPAASASSTPDIAPAPSQAAPKAQTPPAASSPAPRAQLPQSPALVEATRAQVSGALDRADDRLKQVQAIFARSELSESDFTRMRELAAAASRDAETALQTLRPLLDASKSWLDQLGPKPDEKTGTPESAEAAATRADLQKAYNDLDGSAKLARILIVGADQANAKIAAKRREMFARALFQRASSIASPALWSAVAADVPRAARSLVMLSKDWAAALSARAKGWEVAVVVLYMLGAFLAAPPLRRMAQHALDKRRGSGDEPDELQKNLFAAWSAVVIASMPILAVWGGLTLLEGFDLMTPRFAPILKTMGEATARISITAGLLWGMLAPNRPAWRLFDLTDSVVVRIIGMGMRIAIALSVMKILEATLDATAASLAITVVVRGITALAVAVMLARGLSAVAAMRTSADDDRYAALRAIGWAAALTIAAAALAGYVAAAAFLVEQVTWAAGVLATLYMLLNIVSHGAGKLLSADGKIARALSAMIGLKRQSLPQIAVASSGALSLVLIAGAVALIVAPWGIESQDMFDYLRGALGRVKIGDVDLSLSTIVGAVAIFLILWGLTRALQGWLSRSLLPATQLDQGLRDAIRASFGYIGVAFAALTALAHVGFGVEKLALVASALSVGIGFGLQSIVSNFVSGLIVLWERAIRVGDWIAVGGEEGYVRRINVRSTEIETFDRVLVVMPNSNLVSGVVKNWVRGDKGGRIKIRVATRREADPEAVRDLIATCAKSHDSVQRIPAPNVLFLSFDQLALHFELVCFIADVETSVRIKSELTFVIFGALREADLLPNLAPLEALPREGAPAAGLAAVKGVLGGGDPLT